jgi:uncharacterized membrane protein YdjX (TVP38/TMEM64 family)
VTEPTPEPAELAHHPPGSLQRAALRFGLLIALMVGVVLAFRFTPLGRLLTIEHLQALLAVLRAAWWAPIAFVAASALFGAVGAPATPFLILGAAIFGPILGTFWNWSGITLASAVGYLLARFLGRDFVERIGGAKLKRAEKLLHRGGFLPLVAIRFVPIPFSLVNAAAAVVGIRFPRFILASAAGFVLPIAIWTYFYAAWLAAATGEKGAILSHALIVALAVGVVVFLPIGIRRRLRKRRLRLLRERRASRSTRAAL